VGNTLSNHPTDQLQALPTVDTIPAALGVPPAAALDAGYFSQTNVAGLQQRGIDPYIAVGRESHHIPWQERMQPLTAPPAHAPLSVQMAYKLKTAIGQLIYAARKSTVEPVIGIIKEVLLLSANSLCAAWSRRRVSGLWSVSPTTSSACIP